MAHPVLASASGTGISFLILCEVAAVEFAAMFFYLGKNVN